MSVAEVAFPLLSLLHHFFFIFFLTIEIIKRSINHKFDRDVVGFVIRHHKMSHFLFSCVLFGIAFFFYIVVSCFLCFLFYAFVFLFHLLF